MRRAEWPSAGFDFTQPMHRKKLESDDIFTSTLIHSRDSVLQRTESGADQHLQLRLPCAILWSLLSLLHHHFPELNSLTMVSVLHAALFKSIPFQMGNCSSMSQCEVCSRRCADSEASTAMKAMAYSGALVRACQRRRIMLELWQDKTFFFFLFFLLPISLSLLLSHSVCGESGIKKDCSAVGSIWCWHLSGTLQKSVPSKNALTEGGRGVSNGSHNHYITLATDLTPGEATALSAMSIIGYSKRQEKSASASKP